MLKKSFHTLLVVCITVYYGDTITQLKNNYCSQMTMLGRDIWTDAWLIHPHGSLSNSIPELAWTNTKLEVATSEVYLPSVISSTWNSSVHPLPSV